jgi:hypothetical protein
VSKTAMTFAIEGTRALAKCQGYSGIEHQLLPYKSQLCCILAF